MESLNELREKVIGGILCCPKHCAACPYLHEDCEGGQALKRDVLKVLRGERARVLSVEKARESTIVYLEEYDRDTVKPALFDQEGLDGYCRLLTVDAAVYLECLAYGIMWRCWSAEPTEGQRNETKWENEAGASIEATSSVSASGAATFPRGEGYGDGDRE